MAELRNPLLGQIIRAVYVSDDQRLIRFFLDQGVEVVARTEGDCCSNTWIEEVLDVEQGLNSPVRAVEDLALPEALRYPTRHDYYEEEMRYYGCAIRTANGRMLIAYRNSSNGHYGGHLIWPGEHLYSGVYGQNIPYSSGWKRVEG